MLLGQCIQLPPSGPQNLCALPYCRHCRRCVQAPQRLQPDPCRADDDQESKQRLRQAALCAEHWRQLVSRGAGGCRQGTPQPHMCTGNCYRHRAPVFRSYGFGLRNLSDPWFTQKFTNIYKGPGLQVPWFSVLGSEFELQCGWGASAGLPDLHCAGCCVWVCRLWWPHSTCAPPPPHAHRSA